MSEYQKAAVKNSNVDSVKSVKSSKKYLCSAGFELPDDDSEPCPRCGATSDEVCKEAFVEVAR